MDIPDTPEKINDIETAPTHDAVFGEIAEEGPNYRSVRFTTIYACIVKALCGSDESNS